MKKTEMTEDYIKKLIILAKELRDDPGVGNPSLEEFKRHQFIFNAKLNFLLGYILGLESLEK